MRTAATVIVQQRQQTARTRRSEEAISFDRLWQVKLTSIQHNTNRLSQQPNPYIWNRRGNRWKGEKKNEKKRSKELEQRLEEEAAAANRGDINQTVTYDKTVRSSPVSDEIDIVDDESEFESISISIGVISIGSGWTKCELLNLPCFHSCVAYSLKP